MIISWKRWCAAVPKLRVVPNARDLIRILFLPIEAELDGKTGGAEYRPGLGVSNSKDWWKWWEEEYGRRQRANRRGGSGAKTVPDGKECVAQVDSKTR